MVRCMETTVFYYCRMDKKALKEPEGLLRKAWWRFRKQRISKQEEIPCESIRLPGGLLYCYTVSADLELARWQLRRIYEEAEHDRLRERMWYEDSLAEKLALSQPALDENELIYLIQGMLQGRLRTGSRRESLLVVEPAKNRMIEGYQRILSACLGELNHFTIMTQYPQRYEELADTAYEQEGLLLRCVEEVPREYPLGRRLFILNFREGYKIRPYLCAKDTFCFTVSAHGIVKFLDTAVKNRYNIYS